MLYPEFYLIATPHPCICAYCICAYMHRFITSTHMPPAHALHAAASTGAITPTATAYAPHNPHPEGCTRHARAAYQARCGMPCIHIRIHCDHAYAWHECAICIYTQGAMHHRAQHITERNTHPTRRTQSAEAQYIIHTRRRAPR